MLCVCVSVVGLPTGRNKTCVDTVSSSYISLSISVSQLAAEMELKLRCIYFDAIKPELVEGIVHGIYGQITELEDIEFLIRHATDIFPERSIDIDAVQVRESMEALQDRMAAERAAAIKGLELALRGIYDTVEPPLVRALAERVAGAFKKLEELKEVRVCVWCVCVWGGAMRVGGAAIRSAES